MTLPFKENENQADGGFRSLGDFLVAVRRAAVGEGQDKRLMRAPGGLNEGDPTAGGFAVPEVYATKVIGSIYEEAVLAPLCDVTETASPLANYKEPAFDESSRQDGSRWGGSLGYWLAEADNIPASRPRFRMNEYSGKKLILLSYVTNEMFEDANMLEAHFQRAMKAEGAFKLDAAILGGHGNGVPLGITAAPVTIAVGAAEGQVPGTIIADNVRAMWARLPVPCRRRAVWLVNEDADGQLEKLDSTIYLPQGQGGNPYPLLKGRPVLAIEQAPGLGTVGDIVLADLQQYRIVQGAPRFAMSADVSFSTDESAFRFALRVDGMPAYSTPITPFNGSAAKRSPFVTLAAR